MATQEALIQADATVFTATAFALLLGLMAYIGKEMSESKLPDDTLSSDNCDTW